MPAFAPVLSPTLDMCGVAVDELEFGLDDGVREDGEASVDVEFELGMPAVFAAAYVGVPDIGKRTIVKGGCAALNCSELPMLQLRAPPIGYTQQFHILFVSLYLTSGRSLDSIGCQCDTLLDHRVLNTLPHRLSQPSPKSLLVQPPA